MLTISNIKYMFLIIVLLACQSEVRSLNINDEKLAINNGVMFYKEQPYSGILFSKIDTITTYKAHYKKGKKHGKEEKFFYQGTMAEVRFYTQGKKSGTHRAWWDTKQLKLECHFDTIGNQIGAHREWSRNGQLLKDFNYINGQQDGPQKSWDVTGKINANYVVIAGERFGYIGSENCNPFSYD